ncbi:MAG: hypothetical protein ABEN55_11050, partial [Bradymonadaceae bacterium]
MGRYSIEARVGAALVGILGLLGLTGCPGPETGCKTDDACRGSRICLQGRCKFPGDDDAGPDTGRDTKTPDPDSRGCGAFCA